MLEREISLQNKITFKQNRCNYFINTFKTADVFVVAILLKKLIIIKLTTYLFVIGTDAMFYTIQVYQKDGRTTCFNILHFFVKLKT